MCHDVWSEKDLISLCFNFSSVPDSLVVCFMVLLLVMISFRHSLFFFQPSVRKQHNAGYKHKVYLLMMK